MQFVSLKPFSEGQPVVEVFADEATYDLHNDSQLDRVEIDLQVRTVRHRWRVKTPAWKNPDQPDPSMRQTGASLTLKFSGLRSLRFNGELFGLPTEPYGGFDFIEYHSSQHGVGEVRLVLDNACEIVIRASRCELLPTGRV